MDRRQQWAVIALTGWMFGITGQSFAGEPWPYSGDWYAQRAQDPPGSRQIEKDGKLWPPYPRPTGPEQIWTHKYHHAHYWPYPYSQQDDVWVRNMLQRQTDAGWIAANTLHDYHFDAETGQLNSAGQAQMYYILTQVPAAYRQVYVAHGYYPDVAQARAANTEAFARGIVGDNVPPIHLRHEMFLGRPAIEVERLQVLDIQAIPRPRLFIIGVGSRGGSGGGGAQGAANGGQGNGSGGLGSSGQGGGGGSGFGSIR